MKRMTKNRTARMTAVFCAVLVATVMLSGCVTRINPEPTVLEPVKYVYVKDGEELNLAGMTCKVISTPGHTAGGTCYYFEEGGFVVCGDTLFAESVGRTDFPTGSMSTLVRSIKEKLFTLPEETTAYPGHGDSTTIGHEKKYNPFCAE